MNKIIENVNLSNEEIYRNGYNPKRFKAIERHFEKLVGTEFIHGVSWAIMHKGKLISNGGIGAGSAIDHSVPMKPSTPFGIASITKIFTTTAVMALVEDGILRLDAPVTEYIDEFPLEGVTLYHLLTHTSGMYPDWTTYPDIREKQPWVLLQSIDYENIDPETYDWVGRACSQGRFREIGAEWLYCSFGFAVLGEVISRVTGQDAADFITERIIKPCGLSDTRWEPTKETALDTYPWDEEGKERLEKIARGESLEPTDPIELKKHKLQKRIPRTGGGLISTVTDLVKFGEVFLNYGKTESGEHIISRKAVEMMTTEQLFGIPDHCWGAKEKNRRYGIGFDMRRSPSFTYSPGAYMHEGSGPSGIWLDPVEHLVAAWFSPFDKNDSYAHVNYTTQNVIWSGIV
ncbi:MAG: beta-lactamase family protein [Ruminococcus sp.]|nr:beta-lactamase family protein [Ruminococcus sp.]